MAKFIKSFKSISFLSLGSLISSGSTFIIYTILAREVGASTFGVFSSALATTKIFSLLAGFGVSQLWLKLFGKEGFGAVRWVKPSIRFVALSALMVFVLTIITAFLDINDNATKTLLILLIFFICGNITVELVASKLQLEERFDLVAFWQLSPNLFRLVVILVVFYFLQVSVSAIDVGIIYATIGLFFTVLGARHIYLMSKGDIKLMGHEKSNIIIHEAPSIKNVIHAAWPFGLANVFAFIYMQSDIVMVKYINGDKEAGLYNVSFVVLSALLTIPTIVFSKFLMPKYHRWANYDKNKFYKTFKTGSLAMLIIGTIAMVIILLMADPIIPFIFGIEYQPSVQIMYILSLTLPISFLAYSFGATLVTNEHMRSKVKLMGGVAFLNILLNVLLIPKYGAIGASIATLICNFVLLILYYKAVRKKVFITNRK